MLAGGGGLAGAAGAAAPAGGAAGLTPLGAGLAEATGAGGANLDAGCSTVDSAAGNVGAGVAPTVGTPLYSISGVATGATLAGAAATTLG